MAEHPTDETEQRLQTGFNLFTHRRIAEDLDTALKTEMGLRSSRETIEAKYAQTVRQLARLQAENEALKQKQNDT